MTDLQSCYICHACHHVTHRRLCEHCGSPDTALAGPLLSPSRVGGRVLREDEPGVDEQMKYGLWFRLAKGFSMLFKSERLR